MEPALFERVSAPVGLEIGAVTPEEIAVAIVAELIAVRRGSDANLARKRLAQKEDVAPDGCPG
jgi:xanthine dehydrogenase accessory factor